MSTSQGLTRMAGKPQKLRERHGTDSPAELLVKTGAAKTSILDFRLQNYEKTNCYCLNPPKFVVLP